ncbi:MAG: HEPN domain-containing protein [Oscillospiraceae bacterium]|jgi:HEPN domain-containing protein
MARRYNPHTNRDSRRYYDWLDRAGEDIICAGLLVQNDNCYNSAAFHCQQTIEKALKAYILLKSDVLPDGHNLPWLCKRAMRYDSTFSEWLDESATLNRCYIETRYPADLPLNLDFRQVMKYYQMAKSMYLFICEEVDKTLVQNRAHPSQKS